MTSFRLMFLWGSSALCICPLCATAEARIIDATPADYRQKIATLAPGDTLRLAGGTYRRLTLEDINGQPNAPIVIEGASGPSPSVIEGESCCNTVQIRRCSHVVIRGLTIDSLGIDGLDGINAKDGPSHHVLVENNTIRGTGASQQTVGISTKSPAWNWVVRRNTIIQPGTGMYFGNSDGTQPFIAGIIENNLVINSEGYAIQIKHQLPYSLPEIVSGPNSTVIRHNVLIKDDRPSGDGDRPTLLVDAFPDTGQGSNDLYEIYGNFLFHNPRDSLIQASGRAAIHDNILVGAGLAQSAVLLGDHNGPLKVAYVYNNTVYGGANGIRFSSAARTDHLVVGNAVFADQPIGGAVTKVHENVVDQVARASKYVITPSMALGSMNFYPIPGRLEGGPIAYTTFHDHIDFWKDFNGADKGAGTFRGAYAGSGVNPGWQLDQALKQLSGPPVLNAPTNLMVK